jgi:effector-binding domain-containing protein
MKLIKIILLSITGILLLLLFISFILPGKIKVERTLEIKTKRKQAFNLVNNLKEWKQWSPWQKLDSNTIWTFNAIESGVGAKYSWKSQNPQVGEGDLSITKSFPDSLLKTEIHFGNMGLSTGQFLFTQTANGTQVTWIMESEVGTLPFYMQPLTKYFYLLLDDMLGSDFEKGLNNIKVILESQKAIMVGDFESEIRDFEGLNYIGIREKINGVDIGPKLAQHYGSLQTYLQSEKVNMKGAPFTINYSANNNVFDMMTALATDDLLNPQTPIQSGTLKPGKWLVVKYYGSYDKMSPVYQKGFEYLAENNLKPSGAPLEFYLSDPMIEKDTALWLTELVFPFIE